MSKSLRPCWRNCYGPDDRSFLEDQELLAIDAVEDTLAPLDDNAIAIRQLITRFEACYHEADKEAEMIVQAIGSGQPPAESKERPPKRKQELQNARDILRAWCQDSLTEGTNLDVGGIPASNLVSFIGKPTALKVWQVQRIVDKISEALDPSCKYHRMALDLGEYGEPGGAKAGDHYREQSDLLDKTKTALIHYTLDGEQARMSLALAIDLLQPCNWNFVGNLVIILKAINGDLHPDKPFAPCSLNAKLTPLRDRMRTTSNSLSAFCKGSEEKQDVDKNILALLGTKTPVKQWLAASLDKTVRLHLGL